MKANGLLILLTVALVFYFFGIYVKGKDGSLSEKKFLEKDEYLNKRIDSLKAMVLDLAKNQDTIKTDLDTLKSGQRIIFDEVKKQTNKDFWSLF